MAAEHAGSMITDMNATTTTPIEPNQILVNTNQFAKTDLNVNQSNHLLVANLRSVSLEKLVRSKLEVLFEQQKEAQVELNGLYDVVMEQVEKALIEIALSNYRGNQVKTANLLGINRNTLKKKIDNYKIRLRN